MSGKEHEMPSLDCEERDCIVDFKIRKRSRMMYPGACSIEYQSIVQILLEVLFGWDSKKQEGSCGILGTLDAYSVAHEEQGKFTTMVYTFTNLYILDCVIDDLLSHPYLFRSEDIAWPLVVMD